jgi:hypothetical protein
MFESGRMERAAAYLLPIVLFVGHAALHRDWIVDDAGISFAYARNLAHGHGFVAQPGAAAVEGFSNPSWVLLFSLMELLGVFHEEWTAKVLGLLFAIFSFHLVRRLADSAMAGTFACCFLALNPSFVIWNQSGLENPLYGFLTLCLCLSCVRMANASTIGRTITCALLATALAATRPEGLLWAACLPVVLVVRGERWSVVMRRVPIYAAVFAITTGAMFLGRWLYFGAWLPNTYLAKGGGTTGRAILAVVGALAVASVLIGARRWLSRKDVIWVRVVVFVLFTLVLWGASTQKMLRVVATDVGVLVAAAIATTLCLRREDPDALRPAVLVCSFVAATSFFSLSRDWMGEYRFATPLLPFFGLLLSEALLPKGSRRRRILVSGLLLAAVIPYYAMRSVRYAANPAPSLQDITAHGVRTFDPVAEVTGRTDLSVLAADVGGLLLNSGFRVHDLGKLCDRRIAQTMERDKPAFYDYVFDDLRPSIIYVHPDLDLVVEFDGDARFRRDYVVIFEDEQRPVAVANPRVAVGLFVRRELMSSERALSEIRRRVGTR